MWKVTNSVSGQGYSLHIQDKRGRVIASVGSHDLCVAGTPGQFLVSDIDEIEKLAHLIASAPALAAEVKRLRAVLEALLSTDGYLHRPTKFHEIECGYCHGGVNDHYPKCPIIQARVALGKESKNE